MNTSGLAGALARAADAVREQAAARQLAIAQRVLEAAKERAPVESGRLRESGHVESDPAAMTARVVFDAPYAAIVHERLDVAHPNGQAHFLSSASREAGPG